MEATAILMMILLIGLIWGGFAFSLTLALKKERKKMSDLQR
ncbi:MAG: methionine/alanine import family NSS transporter small subunit [Calditrichaeota bacterium]|nr:methionine/alanine import family NSS transporter small subunit [Calditrichota bacterium]